MTDKSKWFVFKLEDDEGFGCFRLNPINDPKVQSELLGLNNKKMILKMSNEKIAEEFSMLIAKYIIKDWENLAFKTPAGEVEGETPYSFENAYQLLMHGDPDMNLANWIIEKSKSIV
ncbi:hypothetical protein [Acinetobacter sp. Ver3]|uniref:hypothetical protein n=1 Tax=Acinetobacter sp. Ver3 TaxID=466088 RepID=UPI00044F6B79|nr:hypothetical protein [Acinetobacter sp. Ver3]EZQ10730.1 hypothetical protein CL42_06230 [Acinetobacter sp. Ver3]